MGIGAAREWVVQKFKEFAKNSGGRMTAYLDTTTLQPDGKRVNVPTILGNAMAPVRVVSNGVDAVPADADGGALPAEVAALGSAPQYLLFIGRINWKKGLDRLIPAMAQLGGMHLVIAGNDEEAYLPVLEALARQHGVQPRIRFTGPVYGAAKLALLRHAIALVAPSYSENFGNVVLEAMAAGCPVVVTPEMGVADIVRESGAGIVVDGAADALASGIAQMVSAPGLLEKMSLNGSATVARQYGWDTVAEQMETVYRSCLTGRHAQEAA